jgi:hypothetical protein
VHYHAETALLEPGEPMAEAAPEQALEHAPLDEQPTAAAPELLVKPIIINPDAPVADKKKGWWRR